MIIQFCKKSYYTGFRLTTDKAQSTTPLHCSILAEAMENVQPQKYKTKPKIFLLTAIASLLVVAVISIAVVQSHKNHPNHGGDAVVKSTCAATLYPKLCVSTINAAATAASASIKSSKDVLITALNYTIYTVERNYFTVKKLGRTRKSLTTREKGALHDCLEMIDDTLDELRRSAAELKDFGFKNYSWPIIKRI
ncbi:UNVERIFIED_CONTAM: Pectinesterase/pectinesterase inhibitor 3 [Sesamum angustifolium]|uniref:Pectinesterase/pectinesterase inhibitor 3 n=1 Tax=Sesamum angustifolium TaxID=2727405 RepID=A0AAW2MS11_9LAMI